MIRIKSNVTQRLPNEYQEVEYIESNGNQCINTGIPLNQYRKCEMEFSTTSIGTTQIIDGGYANTAQINDRRNLLEIDSDGMLDLRYGSFSQKISSVVIASNTKYKISYEMLANSCSLTVDETKHSTSTGVKLITNNKNVLLFGESLDDVAYPDLIYKASASIKLYTAKYYDEYNVLIRNFIPCYRKLDNEVGLYDLVNNKFYINYGSSIFLMGAEVHKTDVNLMPMIENKKVLKRYIGENLVYQKNLDTEFTSCPFPTTWNEVTAGTNYKANNEYGEWKCTATSFFSTNGANRAFDKNNATVFTSADLSSDSAITSIEIDCPNVIKIKPTSLYVYISQIKTATIKGLNENNEWEQIGTISRTGTKTEHTLNVSTDKYFSKFKIEMTRYGSSNRRQSVYEFQIKSGTLRKES